MKIDRIRLYHVAIPLAEPFYPAWIPGYPQTENRFTLLQLITDVGVEGFAAGVAFEREREGLGNLIGPYLIGSDPLDIDAVRQRLREASYLGWRNYWMEAAFWDIRGKVEGKPVYALLGGDKVERISVYASTGEIHPPERRAAEVLQLKDMGFTAVKLRVHSFDPAQDVAQLKAVRRVVGDEMQIAVDANQGWRVTLIEDAPLWTLERATDFAAACAEFGLAWLEEPLDMYAYDELAELRCRSAVPIAGGELNAGWHEFKTMLDKGSYDIYQPDATMGGGVRDAKRVLDFCEKQGLGFTPHTWTNGVGFLINLHVHAASSSHLPIEYPYEPPGWVPEKRDGILTQPIEVNADGTVAVPQASGFGIRIDEDKLSRYGRKYFEITERGIAFKTVREKGLLTALRLARKKGR
jgi:L-alanine-DL-glutamate epimerase-like enolase superfamily enzyme